MQDDLVSLFSITLDFQVSQLDSGNIFPCTLSWRPQESNVTTWAPALYAKFIHEFKTNLIKFNICHKHVFKCTTL